jgi:hypothetical protein
MKLMQEVSFAAVHAPESYSQLRVDADLLSGHLNRSMNWSADYGLGKESEYTREPLTVAALQQVLALAASHYAQLSPGDLKEWRHDHTEFFPLRQQADDLPSAKQGNAEVYSAIQCDTLGLLDRDAANARSTDGMKVYDEHNRAHLVYSVDAEIDPLLRDIQEGFWGVPIRSLGVISYVHEEYPGADAEAYAAEARISKDKQWCMAVGITGIRGFYELSTEQFLQQARFPWDG